MSTNDSRRKFIKQLGSTAALFTSGTMGAMALDQEKIHILQPEKKYLANDKIRVAGIGMGIMGFGDMRAALKVPGVEIAGVCDLYTGHLDRAKEVWGNDLYTTRDFREL
jgi:predicted homoserine dehydrogenase-like protein